MNFEKVKIVFRKYWFQFLIFVSVIYFKDLFGKIFDPINNFLIEKSKGVAFYLYRGVAFLLNLEIHVYSLIISLAFALILNWAIGLFIVHFRKLRIIEAKYGKNDKYIDITSKLNDQVKNNKLKIPIGNSISGDPLVGTNKEAIVKYKFNGDKPKEVVIPEYQVLELP